MVEILVVRLQLYQRIRMSSGIFSIKNGLSYDKKP